MVPTVDVNGAHIPAVGMGTMTLKEGVCVEAVSTALRQVREEMMQEKFTTFSKRFLKEMRSAAMIEYKQ